MESTDRAMSSAEREVVPLNSMCSMKWEIPVWRGSSRREPVAIHTPTETERTCGMASVMTRKPLASVVISMYRAGLLVAFMWDETERLYFHCDTFRRGGGYSTTTGWYRFGSTASPMATSWPSRVTAFTYRDACSDRNGDAGKFRPFRICASTRSST